MSQHFIHNRTQRTKQMFKLRNLRLLSTKLAHFKLMPATGLKKVGTGATKDWKSKKKIEKNQLVEHQVYNMISYKRDVFERQRLSNLWKNA